jgi:hypothetical protein
MLRRVAIGLLAASLAALPALAQQSNRLLKDPRNPTGLLLDPTLGSNTARPEQRRFPVDPRWSFEPGGATSGATPGTTSGTTPGTLNGSIPGTLSGTAGGFR